MILCSFRNLSLSFGTKRLFNGAELLIEQGDRIGLLGLNGMGKSSLFKVLEGTQNADISTPPFTFDKSGTFSLFHVPQNIPPSIPKETSISDTFFEFYPELKSHFHELKKINEEIEAGNYSDKLLERQKDLFEIMDHLEAWSMHHAFESVCKNFGLTDLNTEIGQLSGGQQKKILLSLGLSAPAPLILWDEPTNHLDIETIKHLEDELLSTDKTYIIVSHDRYLLGKVTNKIFQIERGEITTFKGGYEDYLALQAQREEERLSLLNKLKNSFRREDAWMKQGIKARGTRSKKRVEQFNDIKGKIKNIKAEARSKLELSVSASNRKTKILLDAKEMSFSYTESSDDNLFNKLNFNLFRGNKIGLIGDNGVGKTTIIKLIEGELTPTEGTVKRADELKVKVFHQDRKDIPLDKTPFELLGEGTDQVALPDGRTQHVHSYFKQFLFNLEEINRPISTFSGGERNRLQLALNLREDADVWIFDEPTNDLDLESLAILEKALFDFKGSLILISHDRAFLKHVTNRVFLLSKSGMEVFEGGYDQIESYLDVVALEKDLEKEIAKEKGLTQKAPVKANATETTTTNYELTKQIQEKEDVIDKISNLIQELGLHQSTKESAEKITQLSQKLVILEEELLELYEKN
jgi:ATP-binding cassette subfamily F protein uup